tara:strand:+ start:278 stop:511 length:234 start_codon:yes stop_codon:yes gene_type:complete
MNINKYDIVAAKSLIKHLRGRMNTYNQTVESKEFHGFGIVAGVSNKFAGVYLPSAGIKLFKKINLLVVCKYEQNKVI